MQYTTVNLSRGVQGSKGSGDHHVERIYYASLLLALVSEKAGLGRDRTVKLNAKRWAG